MRQLRASEHPIIVSFPHGAVFVFDHDLRYLSAGGTGLAEAGLSRELLVGRTIHEVFPLETAVVMEPLYRAALSGESSTTDVPFDGRTYVQRLAPVRDRRGQVIAGMGYAQEVTAARTSERQLRESEQRFRLAFEHAPIGKAIIALDGRFREVNPVLCRLVGHTPEALLGMSFRDVTHPDDLDTDRPQRRALLRGEIDNYSLEKRYVTAAGAIVWVLVAVSTVRSDEGQPLYFVGQMQDVTDRKATEAALSEANAQRAALLEHAATHDALTGLPNRRLVEQRLTSLLVPPDRRAHQDGVGVLFCDLDGFKAVNDELGHEVGDAVLVETAQRLVAAARAGDVVGRLGGDEFVILVPSRPDEDVRVVTAAVATRVCAAVAAPFPGPISAHRLTVSVGIALPHPAQDAAGVVRDADAAMYLAKRAGKNGFAFAIT